ncbi:hypothetical protein ABTE87_21710, partial [Acinetobacter baumannii]
SDKDAKATLDLYDDMLKPDRSYQDAHDLAKEPILDRLNNTKIFGLVTNRVDFMHTLPTMSKADQEKYRTDPTFRQQLDDKV